MGATHAIFTTVVAKGPGARALLQTMAKAAGDEDSYAGMAPLDEGSGSTVGRLVISGGEPAWIWDGILNQYGKDTVLPVAEILGAVLKYAQKLKPGTKCQVLFLGTDVSNMAKMIQSQARVSKESGQAAGVMFALGQEKAHFFAVGDELETKEAEGEETDLGQLWEEQRRRAQRLLGATRGKRVTTGQRGPAEWRSW